MLVPDCTPTMQPPPVLRDVPSWRQWLALGMRMAAVDVRGIVLALELWAQRSRERRMLLAMDERMRRDIGVSDADVWREASKPFWRA